MPKRLSKAKQRELKEKFRAMDASGDNKLDFEEMKKLLLEGNPNLGDKELKALFLTIDTNNNGTVDFDEFVEFLYGVPRVWVNAPENVEAQFKKFSGKDMDVSEFAKFCKDCNMLCKKYGQGDTAVTFSRVLPRGQRRVTLKKGVDGFSMYDKLLCLVAEKKECTTDYLFELIASGTVTTKGTVVGDVRLHDDKTTYTGAASITGHGVKIAEASPRPASADNYDVGPAGDWEALRPTYRAFQGEGRGLTNREFAKLCEDSKIVDAERFLKGDADIICAKLGGPGLAQLKHQRLDWEQFQEAVKLVALRKKQQLEDIMAQMADCSGPKITCTVADEVRLHDDKETWTGVCA